MGTKKNKKPITIFVLVLSVLIAGGIYYALRHWQKSMPSSVASQVAQASGTSTTMPGPPGISTAPKVPPTQSPATTYTTLTDNEQYKIRRADGTDHYFITLYAIINHPDQYDMYRQQLSDYKQKALQYLKDKNIDTKAITITYDPPEAASL